MEINRPALAYPPSWIDRFTEWVEKLPGPWWLFYVVAALVLVLFQSAVQWQAGTYPIGSFHPFHIWFMVNTPYFLALLHYLDKSAKAALKTSRPALNVNDIEYADLRFRLTHLPAHPTFVTSLITSAGFTLVMLLIPQGAADLGFSPKPLSLISVILSFSILWWIFGTLFYQIVHQLRLISRIYATHARINLFQLSPLYAFSGVTARLAIALTLQNFLWMTTASPDTGGNGGVGTVGIVVGICFLLLAMAVFVLPLWGLHRQLDAEKVRVVNENGQHFETVTAALHRDVESGKLENATRLKDTLAGLEIERNLLQKIPTWPWQPETLRGLITALLLPIVAFLIQYVLQRVFGK